MKIFKIFLGFLFVFISSCASDKYLVRKPYLYEVTKENKKAYLFGTIHSGVIIEDLPEKFWPYFNSADIFVSEANLSSDITTKLPHLMAAKCFSTKTFDQARTYLQTADYDRIKKILLNANRISLSEGLISELTPYGVVVMLEFAGNEPTEVARGEYVRAQTKFILDDQLMKKSKAKVFDTLDKNLDKLVDCMAGTKEENLAIINKYLNIASKKNGIVLMQEMVSNYRTGNSSEIINTMSDGPKCLLEDRNEEWMFKIESVLENYERPFIAVGVGHILSPKKSLVELLNTQGYKVRRMSEIDLPEEK